MQCMPDTRTRFPSACVAHAAYVQCKQQFSRSLSLSLPRRAAKYAIKTRATRELQPGQGVNSIAVKCGKAE